MKFVFASDSFKGTLSSAETGELLCEAAREAFPGCECRCVVMADGGEGSTAAILSAAGGKLVSVRAHDPLGGITHAFYGVTDDGRAVVETAAASGLALIPAECRDVRSSSSFGTGELLARALDDGHTDVTLALGGSATNDGGTGAMAALGVRFLDADGGVLEPNAANLIRIASIDLSRMHPKLPLARITAMCDVDNPLTRPFGRNHDPRLRRRARTRPRCSPSWRRGCRTTPAFCDAPSPKKTPNSPERVRRAGWARPARCSSARHCGRAPKPFSN